MNGSGFSSGRDLRLLLQSRKKAHPSRRIAITATPIPMPAFVPVERLLSLLLFLPGADVGLVTERRDVVVATASMTGLDVGEALADEVSAEVLVV